MANYKPDLSCQNKFIPTNFAEQILLGTFEQNINKTSILHFRLFESMRSFN